MKKPPAISKELATTIRDELAYMFGFVKLHADGHEIIAKCEMCSRKLVVAVYVDGFVKGTDMDRHSEIGRKFWFPRTGSLDKAKNLPKLKKLFGKENAEEMVKKVIYSFRPWFASPRAFIAHLNKTCTNVSLAKVDA